MEIKFEKLFERFNYNIELKENDLTILTGPNGYGKSTILNCIEAISKGIKKIDYFFSIDFKKISIINNHKKIEIIKNNDEEITINDFHIKKETIEDINNFLEIKEIDLESEDLRMYPHYIKRKNLDTLLEELKKFSEIIGETSYIKEQRLIQEIQENKRISRMLGRNLKEEIKKINVIKALPFKFKELINNALREYSNISNELDSSYPLRLLKDNSEMDKKEYQIRIENVSKKFERLKKYDLILNKTDMKKIKEIKFAEKYSNALKIYFDDFDKKYEKYENLVKKLDLYTEIMEKKLKFKKVKISISEGIKIVDAENPEKEIEISKLSSGEKHEIIMFYELIFETNEGILLLIDEPEISLHVVWQRKFIDDLLKVIKDKKISVVISTHSPQIIGHYQEKQIDLGGLYNVEKSK